MILKGLDEAWSKVNAAQAWADGFRFIFGYVSQDGTGKNFSAADITSIQAAGFSIGIVYEFNPESALGGAAAGTRDAAIAIAHAQSLGVPAGVALYAAVDWDVTDAQKPAVLAYADAFLLACTNAGFRSGIYAGYWVCKYLSENSYLGFLWQTYAWSGGQWWPTAAVRQTNNGVMEAGANIDIDETETVDFGQWIPGLIAPPPLATGKNMVTVTWQTVKRGDKGGAVSIAQGILIGHGYSVGSSGVDGDFGPVTEASTRALQSARGIKDDGIFGPVTLTEALH